MPGFKDALETAYADLGRDRLIAELAVGIKTLDLMRKGDWPWNDPEQWKHKNRARGWGSAIGRAIEYLKLDFDEVISEIGFPKADLSYVARPGSLPMLDHEERVNVALIEHDSRIYDFYEQLIRRIVGSADVTAKIDFRSDTTIQEIVRGLSDGTYVLATGLVATPNRRLPGIDLIPVPFLHWKLGAIQLWSADEPAPPELSWEKLQTEPEHRWYVMKDDVGHVFVSGIRGFEKVNWLTCTNQPRYDLKDVAQELAAAARLFKNESRLFVGDVGTCHELISWLKRTPLSLDDVVSFRPVEDPPSGKERWQPRFPVAFAVREGSRAVSHFSETVNDCFRYNWYGMVRLYRELKNANLPGLIIDLGADDESPLREFIDEWKRLEGQTG